MLVDEERYVARLVATELTPLGAGLVGLIGVSTHAVAVNHSRQIT